MSIVVSEEYEPMLLILLVDGVQAHITRITSGDPNKGRFMATVSKSIIWVWGGGDLDTYLY